MLLVAGILAATVLTGTINPGILLSLTFLLSAGAALTGPTWQAVVPELVELRNCQQPSLCATFALTFLA
jgi:hypothetical protein